MYFFLGEGGRLLYVGKASDLRRRLRDHARAHRWAATVHRVAWVVCADEAEALAFEADLIVLLKPPRNGAHKAQEPHIYLRCSPVGGGAVELVIVEHTDEGQGRTYGCFPHLAKGAASTVAKRTKVGYGALLRLLWVAQPGGSGQRIPAALRTAALRHVVPLAEELRPQLHDFLSGRSARLLVALNAADDAPDFMAPALGRDRAAAAEFFLLGPRRLRATRLRHGLRAGPVRADVLARCLVDEVTAVTGEFHAVLPGPRVAPMGMARRALR